MKMLFTRSGFGLSPADDEARKFVARVKNGQDVLVDAVAPHSRNMRQHRLYFAMLKIVVDNLDYHMTPDQLRKLLLRRLGYCDEVRTVRGIEMFEHSMAVHAMKADEFEAFFRASLDFICKEILPVGTKELEDEIMRIVA